MPRQLIITIDGPAGAGKSSVAKRLAQRLGYLYLDSGAFYRGVALMAGRRGGNWADPEWLKNFLRNFELQITSGSEGLRIWCQGQEITESIRAPEVGQAASQVAVLRPVRQWVGAQLRRQADQGGVVTEGRDLGTVVFPEAEVKIYLDAALEIRAERRLRQLQDQGRNLPIKQVKADLRARDRRDRDRREGPLRIPPGGQVIDSSNLSREEVVKACLDLINPLLSDSGNRARHRTDPELNKKQPIAGKNIF